ncbi:replication-relaxation family protein [Gloeobacter morelensis]|nr:replication-relaxation family protein [Gloeobacter morelensis]
MIDLAIDRLASTRQLVARYGHRVYHRLQQLHDQGLIRRCNYTIGRGRPIACCYLTPLGAAIVSNQASLPLREIPSTPGSAAQFRHTLLVGETRFRLAEAGYRLLSEYCNIVAQGVSRSTLQQPDMYVLEADEPTVAVEVDRGYHPAVIRTKLNDWRDRELKVWWFCYGNKQMQRLHNHNFCFNELYDIEQLGWSVF